jgi:hypothetical protein
VLLLAFAVVCGLVVARETLPLFTALQPALNVVTIAAAVGVVWMLVRDIPCAAGVLYLPPGRTLAARDPSAARF